MKRFDLHPFFKKCMCFLLATTLFFSPNTAFGASKPLQTEVDPFSLVHAPESWTAYQSDEEIIVAVIDTGVDIYHEDLKDVIWTNPLEIPDNGIDDDNNGYIDDSNGWNFYNDSNAVCSYNKKGLSNPKNDDNHGTHVAGIIGAKANNGVGIAGVASNVNVKIMPLKVTGGENGTGKTSSLIQAIHYASDMGASICNISLNSSNYSEKLYLTMLKSNMLFVSSAGNQDSGGVNIDKEKTYPASFQLPNLISVSAIDENNELATYSNYGIKSVALTAPGSRIYSTLVGNQYGRFTGTSMATPFVSGTCAILATMEQKYYPSEIKQILMDTVTPISSLENKVVSGGVLNVQQAVSAGLSSIHEKDTKAPRLKLVQKNNKLSISISDQQSGIKSLSYLYGKRTKADFKKGRLGKPVKTLTMQLKKGTYTFYACDHEGNEVIKTVVIK